MAEKQRSKAATHTEPVDLSTERATVLQNIEDEILDADEAGKIVENYDETNLRAIELRIDLKIKLEKKERRKSWDKTLLRLVVIGFIGSYGMIILIGMGVLNFDNNAFAVPSVVAAGIIQTYGLAKIAAEYFFSEDGNYKKKL